MRFSQNAEARMHLVRQFESSIGNFQWNSLELAWQSLCIALFNLNRKTISLAICNSIELSLAPMQYWMAGLRAYILLSESMSIMWIFDCSICKHSNHFKKLTLIEKFILNRNRNSVGIFRNEMLKYTKRISFILIQCYVNALGSSTFGRFILRARLFNHQSKRQSHCVEKNLEHGKPVHKLTITYFKCAKTITEPTVLAIQWNIDTFQIRC